MISSAKDDRSTIVRVCCAYFALFSCNGLHQPFFPIWLSAHAITESQISVIMSAPLLLRLFVTPAIGSFADRSSNRTRVIRVLALLVLATAMLLSRAQGFWPIMALTCLMMLMSQAISPIVDATVLSLVRQGRAHSYGRMRLWGSAGYATAALIGGQILGLGGPTAVFYAFMTMLAVEFVAFLALPDGAGAPVKDERPNLPLRQQPLLVAVMLVAGLALTSQTAFNIFGSIYLREHGFSDRTIGFLWALATTAEIVMFWAGPRVTGILGPFGLLALASGVAALRWSLMALTPHAGVIVLLQLTHAATFSCSYLGLMRFVEVHVSDLRGATVQSQFVTLIGVMTALSTLAVGPIYQQFGSGVFLAAASLAALAFIILLAIRKPLQASDLAHANPSSP
ncbi:MFS transporter [Alsobacter sp. SYSU M60028]|uniref:MFS transporter n=1 Tax=Alsobacter ponti TaxID=2962936 RepID=A0ABT1LAQ9_9HYPH|nr:MFS transporter [Alsobacter ponti]MCP8938562.1 MFS transporter [Alsobacter ponti]